MEEGLACRCHLLGTAIRVLQPAVGKVGGQGGVDTERAFGHGHEQANCGRAFQHPLPVLDGMAGKPRWYARLSGEDAEGDGVRRAMVESEGGQEDLVGGGKTGVGVGDAGGQ